MNLVLYVFFFKWSTFFDYIFKRGKNRIDFGGGGQNSLRRNNQAPSYHLNCDHFLDIRRRKIFHMQHKYIFAVILRGLYFVVDGRPNASLQMSKYVELKYFV